MEHKMSNIEKEVLKDLLLAFGLIRDISKIVPATEKNTELFKDVHNALTEFIMKYEFEGD
jgi:hypothetical protein